MELFQTDWVDTYAQNELHHVAVSLHEGPNSPSYRCLIDGIYHYTLCNDDGEWFDLREGTNTWTIQPGELIESKTL